MFVMTHKSTAGCDTSAHLVWTSVGNRCGNQCIVETTGVGRVVPLAIASMAFAAIDRFAEAGIVYMVADWTNYDAEIAAFLRQYNRNGIPLYLMYPADPDAEPLLLPQLLTRSMVLDALEDVSPVKADIAGDF